MPYIDFDETLDKLSDLRNILSNVSGWSGNSQLQSDWHQIDEWVNDCKRCDVSRQWGEIMKDCNKLYIQYKDLDDRIMTK